jgi:hypothetical protein
MQDEAKVTFYERSDERFGSRLGRGKFTLEPFKTVICHNFEIGMCDCIQVARLVWPTRTTRPRDPPFASILIRFPVNECLPKFLA